MPLLVFVPKEHFGGQTADESRPGLEILRAVGAEALGVDASPAVKFIERGPDGGPGRLLGWASMEFPGRHSYVKETQRWLPCKPKVDDQGTTLRPKGQYWIGLDDLFPVNPASLRRRTPYRTHSVVLGDGNAWDIPVAASLPTVWGLDDETGRPSRRFAPEYNQFCDRVERLFQAATGSGVGMIYTEEWDFCCEALGMNYRINEDVVDALGLLRDEGVVRVVEAVLDVVGVASGGLQKKS